MKMEENLFKSERGIKHQECEMGRDSKTGAGGE